MLEETVAKAQFESATSKRVDEIFPTSSTTALGLHDKMSRHPEVWWAQRSEKLYLTICLPDAKGVQVNSEADGKFSFFAQGRNSEPFKVDLELYGRMIPEVSKVHIGLRNIICCFQKEEKNWWPRLLKSDEKSPPYIKVDWNKWCDEDEEETNSNMFDDMNNMTNPEVMDDDSNDDDEGMLYLPDLERARDR